MAIFEPGTVVKVPFPYVERPVKQFRPALVVSSVELQETHGLLWVLMITSAKNRTWAGDIEISDIGQAGLPAPSVIRCAKIATIEASAANTLGTVGPAQWKLVERMIGRVLKNVSDQLPG